MITGQPFACRCCGAGQGYGERDSARCVAHTKRNPCAIEGCTRTTAAPGGALADDQWLCATHWRAHVPPRSAARRAYHRFFRQAKRHGWDDALLLRFDRFWAAMVTRARRGADEGRIDVAAIDKLFGWDTEP